MNQKIGIVDVGGGYRGVYAAGVNVFASCPKSISPDALFINIPYCFPWSGS